MYAFCVGSLCCNVVLSILSSFFFNNLVEDERVGCFTLILFLLSCSFLCFVSPPRGAMGWFEIVGCSIVRLYFNEFSKCKHDVGRAAALYM